MLSSIPILIALVAASAGCDSNRASEAPADFRVVFVGNSLTYTNDLPGMLEDLFEASGASRRGRS